MISTCCGVASDASGCGCGAACDSHKPTPWRTDFAGALNGACGVGDCTGGGAGDQQIGGAEAMANGCVIPEQEAGAHAETSAGYISAEPPGAAGTGVNTGEATGGVGETPNAGESVGDTAGQLAGSRAIAASMMYPDVQGCPDDAGCPAAAASVVADAGADAEAGETAAAGAEVGSGGTAASAATCGMSSDAGYGTAAGVGAGAGEVADAGADAEPGRSAGAGCDICWTVSPRPGTETCVRNA